MINDLRDCQNLDVDDNDNDKKMFFLVLVV